MTVSPNTEILDKLTALSGQAGTEWGGEVLAFIMECEDVHLRDSLLRFLAQPLSSEGNLPLRFKDCFPGDVPPIFEFRNIETFSPQWAARLAGEIESLNRHFIAGSTQEMLFSIIRGLNDTGLEVTVNLLGEDSNDRSRIEECTEEYRSLLAGWQDMLGDRNRAWGSEAPRIHISLKPSSFYIKGSNRSARELAEDLLPLYRLVIAVRGFMNIDMEHYADKDLFIELYKKLRSHPEVRDYPHLGLVLQAYLRDCETDARMLLEWAAREKLTVAVRLVKGAYWQEEIAMAGQMGIAPPVWLKKSDTDASFRRSASLILQRSDICYFACASHNVDTINYVLSIIQERGISSERYEFQVIYGMLQAVRERLRKRTGRLRIYCPYGSRVYGFPYIVRRLVEATDEHSFLRSILRFRK